MKCALFVSTRYFLLFVFVHFYLVGARWIFLFFFFLLSFLNILLVTLYLLVTSESLYGLQKKKKDFTLLPGLLQSVGKILYFKGLVLIKLTSVTSWKTCAHLWLWLVCSNSLPVNETVNNFHLMCCLCNFILELFFLFQSKQPFHQWLQFSHKAYCFIYSLDYLFSTSFL